MDSQKTQQLENILADQMRAFILEQQGFQHGDEFVKVDKLTGVNLDEKTHAASDAELFSGKEVPVSYHGKIEFYPSGSEGVPKQAGFHVEDAAVSYRQDQQAFDVKGNGRISFIDVV